LPPPAAVSTRLSSPSTSTPSAGSLLQFGRAHSQAAHSDLPDPSVTRSPRKTISISLPSFRPSEQEPPPDPNAHLRHRRPDFGCMFFMLALVNIVQFKLGTLGGDNSHTYEYAAVVPLVIFILVAILICYSLVFYGFTRYYCESFVDLDLLVYIQRCDVSVFSFYLLVSLGK
ncbi:unnamed protein product, partial [Linum tenue]